QARCILKEVRQMSLFRHSERGLRLRRISFHCCTLCLRSYANVSTGETPLGRLQNGDSSQRPFRSCGAGRKPTVRAAGMVIGELVRGLKPCRARRRRTENVPKPGTQKRLSRRIARAICSKARSNVVETAFFCWRAAFATISINSALVIVKVLPRFRPPEFPYFPTTSYCTCAARARTQLAVYAPPFNGADTAGRFRATSGPIVRPDR